MDGNIPVQWAWLNERLADCEPESKAASISPPWFLLQDIVLGLPSVTDCDVEVEAK